MAAFSIFLAKPLTGCASASANQDLVVVVVTHWVGHVTSVALGGHVCRNVRHNTASTEWPSISTPETSRR